MQGWWSYHDLLVLVALEEGEEQEEALVRRAHHVALLQPAYRRVRRVLVRTYTDKCRAFDKHLGRGQDTFLESSQPCNSQEAWPNVTPPMNDLAAYRRRRACPEWRASSGPPPSSSAQHSNTSTHDARAKHHIIHRDVFWRELSLTCVALKSMVWRVLGRILIMWCMSSCNVTHAIAQPGQKSTLAT